MRSLTEREVELLDEDYYRALFRVKIEDFRYDATITGTEDENFDLEDRELVVTPNIRDPEETITFPSSDFDDETAEDVAEYITNEADNFWADAVGGSVRIRAQRSVEIGDGNVNGVLGLSEGDKERNWADLCDFDSTDWLRRIEIRREVDSATGSITIEAARNEFKRSLATLMKDSPYNVDGDNEYSPLLELTREIKIECALVGIDDLPQEEYWHVLERGVIDRINWHDSPLTIECRDLGGVVEDEYIREEREYGGDHPDEEDPEGVPVEGEMQEILDDNRLGHIDLKVPESPGWMILAYEQAKEPVLKALRDLASQIGWNVAYRYCNDSEDMRLMFYEIPRERTDPMWLFSPPDYMSVDNLSLGVEDVRNVVRIVYKDKDTEERETIEVEDQDSIDRYGERFCEITEDANSEINTQGEGQALADNVLHDLKDPKCDQEIEVPFFYPVQVGDLYEFEANGVHYDRNQRLAVVEYIHTITRENRRTTLLCRGAPVQSPEGGQPIGFVHEWLRREARPGLARFASFFPPSQPVNVIATPAIRGVIISYSLNPERDLAGYRVYASDSDDFEVDPKRLVADGRSIRWNVTEYYDETSEEIETMYAGDEYYLKVVAYDTDDNESEPSDEVSAEAGTADENDIADGAVTENKLSDSAVTEDKINDGAVTKDKIGENEVDHTRTEGWTGTFEDADGNVFDVDNGLITGKNS